MNARTEAETGSPVTGASSGADLGILIVRAIVGVLFIGHGVGKLFGWFHQGGLDATSAFFKQVGYDPAKPLVIAAGVAEIGAGVLLVLGLLVPLAAAAVITDMSNAAWVKSPAGFWISTNGYEYEVVLVILAIALTVAGTGAYAIDRNRDWFRNRTGGVVVALVLGLIGSVVMAVIRK
jgi:putative oxidoreductase